MKVSPVIESLELLCKAIRTTPDEHGFALSKTKFRLVRERVPLAEPSEISDTKLGQENYILGIRATLDWEPLVNLEDNCWQVLLDSCIVVDCGQEIKPRSSLGKGLQLCFDLMVTLAAVEFSVVIDGGIIFAGYQTALIPIRTEEDYTQFHLITIDEGQIDPYQCVQEIEERLLITDPLEFKGKMCFLGWCEVAQINLGTKALNANIGHSGGKAKEKSLELNGFGLTAIGGAPTNVASVQVQTNYTFRTHRARFEPAANYKKLLVDTANQLALIYDSMQKRSWIVPKLSLLFHMARAYILHMSTAPGDEAPFVGSYSDARDIIDTLFVIGGTNFGDADQPFLLRNLMLGFNLNLITTTRNLRRSSGNTLNGFEFMEIIHEADRGACMKYLKVQRRRSNWIKLVNLVDSVIVCSNFGDAITASTHTGNRPCSRCNSLPEGSDYLATTGFCLKRLLKQEDSVLAYGHTAAEVSDGVIWNMKGDPFQKCCHEKESTLTCWERPDIFQELGGNRWYLKTTRKDDTVRRTGQSILPSTAGIVFH